VTRETAASPTAVGTTQAPEILHFPTPLLVATIGQCLRRYPYEACGLLLGRRSETGIYVRQAIPCRNELPPSEQQEAFAIDPLQLLAAEQMETAGGDSLVGIYHSHCDAAAAPSESDLATARLWPNLLWLIVAIEADAASDYASWWPGNGGLRRLPMTQPAGPSMLLSAVS